MNHHKYLNKDEFESPLGFMDRFVPYKIKLDKDFSEFFESKCRYYFHYDNHKFKMYDLLSHRMEKLYFNDLIECRKVNFLIVFDSLENKIDNYLIQVLTENKDFKVWTTFESDKNEPPF